MQLYTHYYVSVVVSLKGGSMPPQNPGHQLHGLFPGRYGGKGARLGWAPAMRLSLCQSWKHPKNGELFITFLVMRNHQQR